MDLLTLKTWKTEEILKTIELGLEMKLHPQGFTDTLCGRTLAMLFQKTSTRTRCAFEVGMTQLGGHAIYLDWQSTNFTLADLKDEAQALSRYVDGIVARMMKHKDLLHLASGSEVPVLNGCCDKYHPCQALGDLMTIREIRGSLKGTNLVYVGIQNNVCNSLIVACIRSGVQITVVSPEVNTPSEDPALITEARVTGLFKQTLDLKAAVEKSDFIYTDTWVDMEFFLDQKFEAEKQRRVEVFAPYQINMDLLSMTDALVMHCLPAHKGYEVTAEVMSSPRCIALNQAENRLHLQKAVLIRMLGGLNRE